MNIFTKTIAKIRYKHSMKKASRQLASYKEIYERNERRIQEVKELIEKDAQK